jgi:branched-chain amino acid transport system permease protein
MIYQQIISGLINGSAYASVAVGLVMIYKATEIVNFAQGEFFMLGAYFAYFFYSTLHLSYPVALLVSVLLVGFSGVILERISIRPLINRKAHVASIFMITLALSASLKSANRLISGEFEKPFPTAFTPTPLNIHGTFVNRQQLLVLGSTFVIMIILAMFFKWSRLGKAMRGTSTNRLLASLLGIKVQGIFSMTWFIAAVLGALSGVLLAPIILIYPDMGGIVSKVIAAAIIGGLNSLPGAVLGGIIIGLAENIGGAYISTSLTDVTAFLSIILFLVFRPSGLFGKPVTKRV